MDAHQKKFLMDVLFSNTLMATVQHVPIYSPDSSEQEKEEFRADLRTRLDEIVEDYARGNQVTEEAHIQSIEKLSKDLSFAHPNALKNRRFRIGTAQKALNLYLKYLWCIGEIDEPPHCPFDSQIIAKLPNYNGPCWTKLDRIEDYRALVEAAKNFVEATKDPGRGSSLATWELRKWNEPACDEGGKEQ
jgi:predicted house-cleaning noncanonical NTP pyrophosphatase (MazG superfamily)